MTRLSVLYFYSCFNSPITLFLKEERRKEGNPKVRRKEGMELPLAGHVKVSCLVVW